jgi:hypothetical protein
MQSTEFFLKQLSHANETAKKVPWYLFFLRSFKQSVISSFLLENLKHASLNQKDHARMEKHIKECNFQEALITLWTCTRGSQSSRPEAIAYLREKGLLAATLPVFLELKVA